METKQASDADESQLTNEEFAIRTGSIDTINSRTSLTFTRLDDNFIEMHLRITFKDNYVEEGSEVKGSIAVGPKKIKFKRFGKFTFNKEMFFENKGFGAFKNLFLVVDRNKKFTDEAYDGIRMLTDIGEFDVMTTAKKIEHGTGFSTKNSGNLY